MRRLVLGVGTTSFVSYPQQHPFLAAAINAQITWTARKEE